MREHAYITSPLSYLHYQGGDNNCRCDDPTEPLSREEVRGWTKAHSLNKKAAASYSDWDVVLLGDEFVQEYQGKAVNKPVPSLKTVNKYWNSTFTFYGGGDVEGLALGISGDSVSRCSVMYCE